MEFACIHATLSSACDVKIAFFKKYRVNIANILTSYYNVQLPYLYFLALLNLLKLKISIQLLGCLTKALYITSKR